MCQRGFPGSIKAGRLLDTPRGQKRGIWKARTRNAFARIFLLIFHVPLRVVRIFIPRFACDLQRIPRLCMGVGQPKTQSWENKIKKFLAQSNGLDQRQPSFLGKGTNSKYFRLCRPRGKI